MAYKALLLDLDGTLIDTMGGFADVASLVLNKWYGTEPAIARRQYIETSGIPFRHQVELLHPGDPRNDHAAREFEERKQEAFFSARLQPDVIETVRSLQNKGVKVVVSSNNYQQLVDDFFARNPVISFDLVLGAREHFYKGRDHFREVQKVFGITPSEILFVGDSLKDAERAFEYGVAFIGKIGTFTKEEFETRFPGIRTVENLKEILGLF